MITKILYTVNDVDIWNILTLLKTVYDNFSDFIEAYFTR